MPQTLVRRIQLPGVKVQQVHDELYKDEAFVLKFHKHKNEAVECGAWDQAGRRTVVFTTKLELPAAIQKIMQPTVVVTDTQCLQWEANREGFTVASTLAFSTPGTDRFTSVTAVATTRQVDGGSEVEARVECHATGPWGMIAVIESTMMSLLNVNVQQYMDFARVHVMGTIHGTRQGHSRKSSMSSYGEMHTMDEFYDTEPWDAKSSDGHMLLDALSEIQEAPGALLNLHLSSIHTTLENIHKSQLAIDQRLRFLEEQQLQMNWRSGGGNYWASWAFGLVVVGVATVATARAWPKLAVRP